MRTGKDLGPFKTQKEANTKLIGKVVKVIANRAGHNYPIGSRITITGVHNISNLVTCTVRTAESSYSFYLDDFEISGQTIEELEKDIVDYEKSIKEFQLDIENIKSKISFMKKNEIKEFDENQFKAYYTLELLDNKKLNNIQRAQAIAKLIKG